MPPNIQVSEDVIMESKMVEIATKKVKLDIVKKKIGRVANWKSTARITKIAKNNVIEYKDLKGGDKVPKSSESMRLKPLLQSMARWKKNLQN